MNNKITFIQATLHSCFLELFHERDPYHIGTSPSSLSKKLILSIAKIFSKIQFLSHFQKCSRWLRSLIFQTNTNFLMSHTKYLTSLLQLQKMALFMAVVFQNINFCLHFILLVLTVYGVCNTSYKFQLPKMSLHSSLISEKN